MRAVAALAVATVLLATASGCSSDDDASDLTTSGATQTTQTTASPDTGGDTGGATTTTGGPGSDLDDVAPVGDAGLDTVTSPGYLTVGQPTAQLIDVRQSRHSNFQRIVFDFDGPVPQYQIGYIDPPLLQPGSGKPQDIASPVILQISADPAATVDVSESEYRPTYTGPRTITLDGPGPAAELIFVSDYEATMVWAVGLTSATPFAVGTLDGPSRLVVDIVDAP